MTLKEFIKKILEYPELKDVEFDIGIDADWTHITIKESSLNRIKFKLTDLSNNKVNDKTK